MTSSFHHSIIVRAYVAGPLQRKSNSSDPIPLLTLADSVPASHKKNKFHHRWLNHFSLDYDFSVVRMRRKVVFVRISKCFCTNLKLTFLQCLRIVAKPNAISVLGPYQNWSETSKNACCCCVQLCHQIISTVAASAHLVSWRRNRQYDIIRDRWLNPAVSTISQWFLWGTCTRTNNYTTTSTTPGLALSSVLLFSFRVPRNHFLFFPPFPTLLDRFPHSISRMREVDRSYFFTITLSMPRPTVIAALLFAVGLSIGVVGAPVFSLCFVPWGCPCDEVAVHSGQEVLFIAKWATRPVALMCPGMISQEQSTSCWKNISVLFSQPGESPKLF